MIDIFQTRSMVRALEERRAPRTFLIDTFFPETETSDTETVDIDVIRNKRKLAPFVTPLKQGKLVERQKFQTKSFKPAYVKPKMMTSAAELLTQRQMGEPLYATQTPEQRAAAQLAKDLAEMDDQIIRREEWMAASAMDTGTIHVKGEGVDVVVDFGMSASHKVTLAGGDLWTDTVNSDPIGDLRAWKKLVSKDSGLVPTDVIFGEDVVTAFLNHPKVKDYFDNRRFQVGNVNMSSDGQPDGVTLIANNVEGLNIWSYDEWYVDDDTGVETAMVPADKVWMASRRARAVRHYGAIKDLKAGLVPLRRFPKSWEEEDPSVRWVMVQSAPLVVPHQIDAFLSAKAV